MISPWGGVFLGLHVSVSMTKSTTPERCTDRTERNGASKVHQRMYFLVSCYYILYMFCLFSSCFDGRWACVSLETPSTCSVEAGSHFTTFDGKTYTFHGDCYYTLAKVDSKVCVGFNCIKYYTTLVIICVLFLFFCFHLINMSEWCTSEVYCPGPVGAMCAPTVWHLFKDPQSSAEQRQKQRELMLKSFLKTHWHICNTLLTGSVFVQVLTFSSDGTVKQNMQTVSLPHHSGEKHSKICCYQLWIVLITSENYDSDCVCVFN